jgi:glutaredoxin-like YruB-family protein
MKIKKITIYSTPTCHYCNLAKDFFKAKGLKYEEINVATDLAKRKEMVEKSGQMGVPVIDIGGELVVGFNEETVSEILGLK